jgi:hypothetical protein
MVEREKPTLPVSQQYRSLRDRKTNSSDRKGRRVVPSFDPEPVFFVPVLDRQFGIAVEAVVIRADLRFNPARFVAP